MEKLIVIFGGADYQNISDFDCNNLSFSGKEKISLESLSVTEPDEFVANISTGKVWKDHGIKGSLHYENQNLDELESFLSNYKLGRKTKGLRNMFYNNIRRINSEKRRYISSDYNTSSLLEKDSIEPITLPSWNPEVQWLIYRNTIRQNQFEDLGEKEALRLIEKNYSWRKKLLFEKINNLEERTFIIHFQYLDSYQHLFYENKDYEDFDKIKAAYEKIDGLAGELREHFRDENIIFLSEYGMPKRDKGDKFTHKDNAFVSSELISNEIKSTMMFEKLKNFVKNEN